MVESNNSMKRYRKQIRQNILKLGSILSKPIIKECDVICILVNIRKILECRSHLLDKENQLNSVWSLLKFYCDWTLHIEIDRHSSAKKIVKKLDKVVKDYLDNKKDEEHSKVLITEIISFEKFQKELSDFLLNFNLPNDIAQDNKEWKNFIKFFIDIIADCPLTTKSKLKHVKQFLITKKHNKNYLSWQIELIEKNGVQLKLIGLLYQ